MPCGGCTWLPDFKGRAGPCASGFYRGWWKCPKRCNEGTLRVDDEAPDVYDFPTSPCCLQAEETLEQFAQKVDRLLLRWNGGNRG
jgi:hypothetical protein